MGVDTLERPAIPTLNEAAEQPQDLQAANESIAANAAYEHIRADGTVEYAKTAEDAIRRCPVLGEIALKNPSAAMLLLDMNRLGRQKMAEEALRRNQAEESRSEPQKTDQVINTPDAKQESLPVAEPLRPALRQEQSSPIELTAIKHAQEQILLSAVTEQQPTVTVADRSRNYDTAQSAKVVHQKDISIPKQVRQKVAPNEQAQPVLASTVGPQIHQEILVANEPDKDIASEISVIASISEEEWAENGLESTEASLPMQSDLSKPDLLAADPPTGAELFDNEDNLDEGFNISEPSFLIEQNTVVEYAMDTVDDTGEADWLAEIAKDPAEFCEDFSSALQVFAENSAAKTTNEANSYEPFDYPDGRISQEAETELVPDVFVMAAKHLVELEAVDKELVAPILLDIVNVSLEIKLAESQDDASIKLADEKAKLEELCGILFEAIGIDYDEQSVNQFMQAMINLDLQPEQSDLTDQADVDLEHEGTKEAKICVSQPASASDIVVDGFQYVLGKFVIFSALTNFLFRGA